MAEERKDWDDTVRFGLLGGKSSTIVGKTVLLARFADGDFREFQPGTIGIA